MTLLSPYHVAMGVAACCGVGSLIAAILGSRLAVSTRKAEMRLLTYCMAGACLCIAGLAALEYQHGLPVYRADGVIQQAHKYTSGKGGRTRLHVLTAASGELVLDASGTSQYFRRGEHLLVTYKGVTGWVLKATFLNADGSVEGVFNGTDLWPAYFIVIGGILVLYAGVKAHRRDPEGAEQRASRKSRPFGAIDEASLMHLPQVSRKEDDE